MERDAKGQEAAAEAAAAETARVAEKRWCAWTGWACTAEFFLARLRTRAMPAIAELENDPTRELKD